jgi:NADH-quinone oxidoreductase subunit M
MPLFPNAMVAATPFMLGLAVVGIIYGAMVAMVQPDLKKLVAYSSVSHLGFVMLGLFAVNVPGIEGAIYQMLNHGLSTGALFLLVGMIYERRHTRQIADFGGLWKPIPRYAAVFLLVTFSSVGLPGLNGFIGEFLILMGSWRSEVLLPRFTVVAASGVILSAVYMLWMFQRVNYGEVTNPKNESLPDLSVREWCVLAPTVALAVVMGVFPNIFLHPMAPAVERMVQRMERRPAVTQVLPPAGAPAAVAGTQAH